MPLLHFNYTMIDALYKSSYMPARSTLSGNNPDPIEIALLRSQSSSRILYAGCNVPLYRFSPTTRRIANHISLISSVNLMDHAVHRPKKVFVSNGCGGFSVEIRWRTWCNLLLDLSHHWLRPSRRLLESSLARILLKLQQSHWSKVLLGSSQPR